MIQYNVMNGLINPKNALISVFNKEGLEDVVKILDRIGVTIYSTGGTQKFIESKGFSVSKVEDLTSYPSILGGRVKTLHPKIFGGILSRRDVKSDTEQLDEYEIPEFDIVIVDLYPFQETINLQGTEKEIIEKIDIGGISLIRAAAKNFKDVTVIASKDDYSELINVLKQKNGTTINDRKKFATNAFNVSSEYDTSIFSWFNKDSLNFKTNIKKGKKLRYGENPHQLGTFYGNLEEMFTQINGKELSYNNLLDLDSAINLISEFDDTTFAILKHNNACGLSSRKELITAWKDALSGDPISAFGGVLISNRTIDLKTAKEINKLFCEILIAPDYDPEGLEILKSKKNRIILVQRDTILPEKQFRTILNGVLEQDKDLKTDTISQMKVVTHTAPTEEEWIDLEFASKICKHSKSNTIVLVKGKKLLASGVGQTSRVDALQQAIEKANRFGFDLNGSVMASDAFFPFPDCVKIAQKVGVSAIIQPGGSIKDQLSIEYCDQTKTSMVMTGTRHFKH